MNNNRNNNNNNNNNNSNNRRRGRGNNRQNGGGQPVNRIDSRARGNAPQLLEKYRKLALDAHLNGDRVAEEYYLQFADHYFRVLADSRVRQDEGRAPRRDDRWNDGLDGQRGEGDDAYDYSDGYGDERAAPAAAPAPERREQRPPRVEEPVVGADEASEEIAAEPGEPRNVYEPAENPFVRDGRSGRGPRQRGARRDAPLPPRDEADGTGEAPSVGAESSDFDPAALPPSVAPTPPIEAEAEAKPKRRGRRPAPRAGDSDEALQAFT